MIGSRSVESRWDLKTVSEGIGRQTRFSPFWMANIERKMIALGNLCVNELKGLLQAKSAGCSMPAIPPAAVGGPTRISGNALPFGCRSGYEW